MNKLVEVRVPDIGDFTGVPVIEVLVSDGDSVAKEQSLITLESDKATMEVPSPVDGMIESVGVNLGDAVSEGDLIATIRAADAPEAPAGEAESSDDPVREAPADDAPPPPPAASGHDFDLVVLGSGPGGYAAAFRAADLGLKVALVERYPTLGGVCLNVGCIPSKALLHAGKVIDDAASMAEHGVRFGEPEIDLPALRGFKDGVVEQLTKGLAGMAKQRKVEVIQGTGAFAGPHEIVVRRRDGESTISFENAIVAVGSEPLQLPGMPWGDPRLMDSTSALRIKEIPERLLVIGGGIIGLELACVYEALGSRVTVVELTPNLMPGTDPDLVRPLHRRISKKYEAIYLATKVTRVECADDSLVAHFEGAEAPESAGFGRVLVAVGRSPNGNTIDADKAGIVVTERGFIDVDRQMRTNVPHIFAIGDVVGQPMLAHKATHEGKVAAEVCAGEKSAFDARVIPSVAYTDPEIAWVGVTETEAKSEGLDFGVGKFPWAASGRALGIARTEGFTKLLFDNATRRIIGAGITGPNAGDLIAECALAIEMGCEAGDIGLTIHPHPTLSESIAMAAEVFEGTVTDLYIPRK